MRRRLSLAILLAACGGDPAGPGDAGTDAAVVARAPSSVPTESVTPSASPRVPSTGARVAIPAGTVLAGSRPGTPFRRPQVEADLAPIEVPAFEIDRVVGHAEGRADPARVSLEAAVAECSARGARVCDELEWERACEGDAHVSLPSADQDYAACAAHPEACVGAMGVVAQGVQAPEWARSGERWVLRGAREDQEAPFHRCDARTVLDETEGREGAVRCCRGPAPTLSYPTPARGGLPFTALDVDLETLRAAMRSTPELAPFADAFVPFDVEGAGRAYTRADLVLDDTLRARLAAGPLVWSPAPGERAWLFAGTSGESTLIAVLYPLDGPPGAVVHGASFVFREEVPVALTPVPQQRASVTWSTAVGRAGENGVVRLDEDGVIRIVAQ